MNGTPSAPPVVGQSAPDLVLPSTSHETVDLASFRGKSNVLLAFFPAAFTGVCTSELCELSQDLAKFEDANAAVFGISVDSIPALLEFKAKHGMVIDLLSDVRRDVTQRYGVLNEAYFCADRAYFIVGIDGTITWMHIEEDLDDRRDNGELLEHLAQLD